MMLALYIQSCVEYALVYTENQQKTYVDFTYILCQRQIKLDLRLWRFCLGLLKSLFACSVEEKN